jgi:hypothetical protein
MSQAPISKLIIAVGLVFSVVEGCKCEGGLGKPSPGICAKDTSCPKGQVYRKGVCALERCDNRAENPDADCCPGQLCKNDGRCVDNVTVCTADAACGGARTGRLCVDRPGVSTEGDKLCSFPLPNENGECASEYRPFNKRCIKDLPCDGGCDDGALCNIETNDCEKVPDIPTAGSNCDVSCAAGTIKVLADPDSMVYGVCCAVSCLCEALPPLAEGAYGRYASAQAVQSEILIASYNETYGDLVLSHHDKVSGKKLKLEFVDGVPTNATGQLQGDPTGPRGGHAELGPNVGLYASLAIGPDGQPRIAYYDNDTGKKDLKYAEKTADGWVTHVVDADGDAGAYAQMAYISGRLRIVYFVRSGKSATGEAGPFTMVRYAEASKPSPQSAGDWTFKDASPPVPVRNPCGGSCDAAKEKCLFIDMPAPGHKTCGKADTSCDGMQPMGTISATPNGGMKGWYFEDPLPPATIEVPAGAGLFPSMAQKDDKLLIAYYDNYSAPSDTPPFVVKTGTLRGVTAPLSGGSVGAFSAPVTIDKGSVCGAGTRDVGRYATLAVAVNGKVGVAYSDNEPATGTSVLRFYQPLSAADSFLDDDSCLDLQTNRTQNNRIAVADSGVATASGGVSVVGADAFLYFDAASRPFIVYQDQSNENVRVSALRSDGKWFVDYLSQGLGDGFEAQLVSENQSLWLVSVMIHVDSTGPTNIMQVRPISLPSIP